MHRVTTIEYNKSNFTSGSGFGKGTGRGCGVIKSGGSRGGGNGDGCCMYVSGGGSRMVNGVINKGHDHMYNNLSMLPLEVIIESIHI